MDHAVVLISVFAVFIPALMAPGPDFVAVLRSAMSHGARAGLLTTLGVSAGLGLYATLSLVGLSALLAEWQWLAWAVRVAGGAYLIWLGVKLLRARRAPPDPAPSNLAPLAPPPPDRAILFGFLVTLTNPKAMVLFTSVFATAVSAATPGWVLATMIGLVVAASLVWYGCVSLFIAAPPMARRFQRGRHWVERTAGGCFIIFGGKVLADARNPVAP